MSASCVVYVLKNPNGKRYIGVTTDIQRRITEHNQGMSRFTKHKGPWSLYWLSKPMSHGEALVLEKKMKRQKGGRGLTTLMQDRSA